MTPSFPLLRCGKKSIIGKSLFLIGKKGARAGNLESVGRISGETRSRQLRCTIRTARRAIPTNFYRYAPAVPPRSASTNQRAAKNGAKLVGNWDGFRRPLFSEAVKRYQSHIFTYIWIFRALFEFWRGRLRFLIRQIKVANIKQGPYCCTMSVEAAEFIEIFEALPVEKKIEVADFARFLFEKTDDDRWEQIVNGEKTRMKLEEYAQICEKEGSVLLDFEKL